MSPLPYLHKRDSSCTYYDASCSTHRLVILIIIIAIGIIVSAILSLLYVRSRRSKANKMRLQSQRQQAQIQERFSAWDPSAAAPPPYEPRKPERAARASADWR
ncbi:hypothetical protein IQ06DRAFT_343301 [Phaeosphaeriaceae sp. SRC1lsM3a]|nr:hypothetical protein IQ06DRAFT_343301 [Stagonospora sp. SRC1lsM3a]